MNLNNLSSSEFATTRAEWNPFRDSFKIVSIPRTAIAASGGALFNQSQFTQDLNRKLEEVKEGKSTIAPDWITPTSSPLESRTSESNAPSESNTPIELEEKSMEEVAKEFRESLAKKEEKAASEVKEYMHEKLKENGELTNHLASSFDLTEEEIKKASNKIALTDLDRKKLKLSKRFASLGGISKPLPVAILPLSDRRFNDVECPMSTIIEVLVSKHETRMLHANNVHLDRMHVICTQAPMKTTEHYYWRTSFEHTDLIIDLVHKKDLGEHFYLQVHNIFPNLNETKTSGHFAITCTKESKVEEAFIIKEYTITDTSKTPAETKTVVRLSYPEWPDLTALNSKIFGKLVEVARNYAKQGGKPPLINCKAGIGRTGTLAVGMAIAEMIEKGKITKENYIDQIDTLIIAGRCQRGTGFVQKPEQYESIVLLAESLLGIAF